MHVTLTTSAGGRHPNQDVVAALPHAVVLLDGAGMPDTEAFCRHGVAWYARRLGAALIARLASDDGPTLVDLLAEAIVEVTDAHRDSCDVSHTRSPSSTVLIVREEGDDLDYLVLGDSTLVIHRPGRLPEALTDSRETALGRDVRAAFAATREGSPERERARAAAAELFAASRNRPGGFWMAKDDPRAAAEAVVGRIALAGVAAVGLFSNGVSRLVDPWGEADWAGILDLIAAGDPDAVIARVRDAESRRPGESADDATFAVCTTFGSREPR